MNPLTLVKRLNNINAKEADLGISEEASWHAKYKDSAYIYVGGLPFDLTEGDLLAVFSQYGEIVDVNLVRDKGTGKSRGFAFLAYEDQRSTTLAVDNFNGTQILGRIIRVDHCEKYKKKEEEDEETEREKREARGVCRAFQKGECTRGAGCKFSHDEQRAANTGWGHEDKSREDKASIWGHDKFESRGVCFAFQRGDCTRGAGCKFSHDEQKAANTGRGHEDKSREDKASIQGHDKFEGSRSSGRRSDMPERAVEEGPRSGYKDSSSRGKDNGRDNGRSRGYDDKDHEPKSRDDRYRREERRPRRDDNDSEQRSREDRYRRDEKRSRRDGDDELKPRVREDRDKRDENRSSRHEPKSYQRDDWDDRGDKRSVRKDSPPPRRDR